MNNPKISLLELVFRVSRMTLNSLASNLCRLNVMLFCTAKQERLKESIMSVRVG